MPGWRFHVCLLGGKDYLHPGQWRIDFSEPHAAQAEVDRLTAKRQWLGRKIKTLHGDLFCAARDYIKWIDERLDFLNRS